MKKDKSSKPPELRDEDNVFKNGYFLADMKKEIEKDPDYLEKMELSSDFFKRSADYVKGEKIRIGDVPDYLDPMVYLDQFFDKVKKEIQSTTKLNDFEGFETLADSLNEIALDKINNPFVKDSTIYKRMKIIADKVTILIDAQKRRIKTIGTIYDHNLTQMSEKTNRKNRSANHIIHLLDDVGLFEIIEEFVASKMGERGRIKAENEIISQITGFEISSFEKYTHNIRGKKKGIEQGNKVATNEAIEFVNNFYASLRMT